MLNTRNVFITGWILAFSIQGLAAPIPQSAKDVLLLPPANRERVLAKSSVDIASLGEVAFNNGESVQLRWRALLALGYYPAEASKPLLEKAVKSPDWMLRNGALIASRKVDRQLAVSYAEKLLSDPALVVRTAAVETIRELKAENLKPLLWEKLYSKENYRGKQSLWIRRHIVETLATMSQQEEIKQFVKVLEDEDTSLHPAAVAALAQTTQESVDDPTDPVSERRKKWLRWWQAQATVESPSESPNTKESL